MLFAGHVSEWTCSGSSSNGGIMCQSVSVEWFSTCSEIRFWFTLIGVGWLGFLFCGLKHVMVERLKLVLVDVVIVNDF